jgi:hypothetical protein
VYECLARDGDSPLDDVGRCIVADRGSTDWLVNRLIRAYQAREQARRREFRRKLRPRETIGTMLLGNASLSLATVMLIVTFAGLCGVSFERFSERREVMDEATLTPAGRIWVPSHECHRLAWFAMVLGGIGLAISLRRRKLSWLSAIGFALALLTCQVVAECERLMWLVPS